jgi:3-hydroxyacyl-[acyl-carrier-protein] dehydratase
MAAPSLPLAAGALLPHRPPMLLLERLLEYQDGWGVAEARPGRDSLFTEDDGGLHPAALVEIMAQGYAAVRGYEDLLHGRPVKNGLLVGIRAIEFRGRAFAGEILEVRIRRVGGIEGFVLAEAEVRRDGALLAAGTLKMYIPEEPLPLGSDSQ